MRRAGHGKGQNGDAPSIIPFRIVADPRKFTEYVLVPGHPKGEDHIFIGRLGYRPRNEEDGGAIAKAYVAQAR